MTSRPCFALPPVRGTYAENAPLRDLVWFRVGGAAEILFRPADTADLADFLAARPRDLNVCVIGVGSNILVRDGGIAGVVIRLPSSFGRIAVEGTQIRAGAAALDGSVARAAADAGLAGLEFLRGVPGTIGGALRMNAGCYGRELRDVLVEATAVDGEGRLHTVTAGELGLTYRHCAVPEDWIFVEAVLKGEPQPSETIHARMEALVQQREDSQPVRAKTGGSTFKNPPGGKAWELIDKAGCRGLRIGDAQVAEKHCNFLINLGSATASEIEQLGEEVRARVKAASGIQLEWEIKRMGRI